MQDKPVCTQPIGPLVDSDICGKTPAFRLTSVGYEYTEYSCANHLAANVRWLARVSADGSVRVTVY